MTAAVPSPPPIPERTAHDALCDRATLRLREMVRAFAGRVPTEVACYVHAAMVRIQVERASPEKARFYVDIYEHFARTDEHYAAITASTAALCDIASSLGQETER
jgi:hypothetical protein